MAKATDIVVQVKAPTLLAASRGFIKGYNQALISTKGRLNELLDSPDVCPQDPALTLLAELEEAIGNPDWYENSAGWGKPVAKATRPEYWGEPNDPED